MRPAFDAFDLLRRAAWLEPAVLAGRQVAIMVDVTTMVRSDNALGELRAGRTGRVVRRRVIDEIATSEAAKPGPARGIYLRHAGQHAGALALQNLFAVEVTTTRQDGDLGYACGFFCPLPHRNELHAVVAVVHDLMRH